MGAGWANSLGTVAETCFLDDDRASGHLGPTQSCGLQEHDEEHRLGTIRIHLEARKCSSVDRAPAQQA